MLINAHPRLRRLFKLRTILLVVMLSILFFPLGSIYFLRFYENQLVRNTEIELISQSAALAAIYRQLIQQNHLNISGNHNPIPATLDLSSEPILPRRPEARTHTYPTHPLVSEAGKKMQPILAATQQVTLAGMRLLDSHGVVIAGQYEMGYSLAHITEVQQALAGKFTAVIRERISDEPAPPITSISQRSKIRVFTAFPIIDQGKVYGVVYLSRTPQNIIKSLYDNKNKLVLLILSVLGMAGLLVLFISSRLSRPIRELIEQTQKVTRREIETIQVLQQPGTYELSQLSKSFAEMSKTLHERSTYIKDFASHVSHEFKTPLTSMQGTMELLQEHIDDMPRQQRQRFFDNLQEDTERLKRLVNRLLEQARADSSQASDETSSLLEVLEQLQSRYLDHPLELNYQKEAVDISLKIAPNQLKIILNNLLDNSLKHDADQVTITASHHHDNHTLRLTLHDNGSGISANNLDKIFTPFFTTRRDNGGTGLGLGIVESLLKVWNGEINVKESKKGALFEIILPVE